MPSKTGTARRHILAAPVPPARLEGEDVHLEPTRSCTYCGNTIQTARVVRLLDDSYAYSCHGCATKS